MSSVGGRGGLPFLSAYNASKAAISSIGDSLRQEMRPFGVEVSIIEPGAIATPFWDKGEAEAPEILGALGDDLVELYGERLEQVRAMSAKTGSRGQPPETVAEAVEHALTAARPKARYLVGLDAKVQGTAMNLLPSRLFDRVVERELDRA